MNLTYAISTDEETGNKYIFSQSSESNSNHSEWRERMSDKIGITEFIEVETEDSRYTSSSNLKVVNGVVIVDESGIAERLLTQSKATHEKNAYAQQNAYFNANKKAIFDAVVYNRPPTDMAQLPKINTYKIFIQLLWSTYHTRVSTGSVDFDYTSIKPTTEYSYVEMELEWVDYNADIVT